MAKVVDLNSDLGESFGAYTIGMDKEVLQMVSSANIACGYHAGDPSVMNETIRLAKQSGVAIGAHPGYPDLQGFGRRKMDISQQEAKDYILYQLGAFSAFAKVNGEKVQHVKLHGAFYNDVSANESLAKAVVEAVMAFDPDLYLLCLSGSQFAKVAMDMGANVANEVFADRAYEEDGSLVNRRLPGAVITDHKVAVDRVVQMVLEGTVETIHGTTIPMVADSICVHGDNPEAVAFVKEIRERLEKEEIEIKRFSDWKTKE